MNNAKTLATTGLQTIVVENLARALRNNSIRKPLSNVMGNDILHARTALAEEVIFLLRWLICILLRKCNTRTDLSSWFDLSSYERLRKAKANCIWSYSCMFVGKNSYYQLVTLLKS